MESPVSTILGYRQLFDIVILGFDPVLAKGQCYTHTPVQISK